MISALTDYQRAGWVRYEIDPRPGYVVRTSLWTLLPAIYHISATLSMEHPGQSLGIHNFCAKNIKSHLKVIVVL